MCQKRLEVKSHKPGSKGVPNSFHSLNVSVEKFLNLNFSVIQLCLNMVKSLCNEQENMNGSVNSSLSSSFSRETFSSRKKDLSQKPSCLWPVVYLRATLLC